jgi:nitric oxide reductase NorE protein
VNATTVRRLPGEEGVWVIIFGDMMLFSLFFAVFMYYRAQSVAMFIASQAQLNQLFGLLNTCLMLSSSWFVALAVHAARRRLQRVTPICFALGVACGAAFVTVKVLEYRAKILSGITLNTNDFFMFYYMLTGIHALHVLIGMGVLAFLASYSRRGEITDIKVRHIESGASFWHVVDLLWIVLFALLYLVK